MRVAILGAGHGGLATAGHISLKGHSVNLFSFYGREIDPVVPLRLTTYSDATR
jgi:2-polyprenyl-6-methoxyphenol hydroxylase-like FAD-dependent oxidoreductase